jgi:hypothetical protein
MSRSAICLDIEKLLWPNRGLLFTLPQLESFYRKITLISSILSERTFKSSVAGEKSAPKEYKQGAKGSIVSPTLYSLYIDGAPTPKKIRVFNYPSLMMTILNGSLFTTV